MDEETKIRVYDAWLLASEIWVEENRSVGLWPTIDESARFYQTFSRVVTERWGYSSRDIYKALTDIHVRARRLGEQ